MGSGGAECQRCKVDCIRKTLIYTPYIRYAIYNIFYYYYICHLPYIFDMPKVAFDRINIGPEGRWKGSRNCRNSVCPPYVRLFGSFVAKFVPESGLHARKHWVKSTFSPLRNCRKSVCRHSPASPSLRDICRIIFSGYVN